MVAQSTPELPAARQAPPAPDENQERLSQWRGAHVVTTAIETAEWLADHQGSTVDVERLLDAVRDDKLERTEPL